MSTSSYIDHYAGSTSWNMLSPTASIQDAEDFNRQSSACSPPAISSCYTFNTTTSEHSVNTQQVLAPFFNNTSLQAPHFNSEGQYPSYPSKSESGSRTFSTAYIFASTQELAEHYGIPADLPPPPRPPARNNRTPPPPADFAALNANYQAMRAQKPIEAVERNVDDGSSTNNFTNFNASEYTRGSPSYLARTGTEFEEQMLPPLFCADGSPQHPYLTSPMDTPLSEFLSTPQLEDDMLTGPIAIQDDSCPDMNLFGGVTALPSHDTLKPPPTLPCGAQLYTISPEETPNPNLDAPQARTTVPSRNRSPAGATGTRRNVTPAKLIPLDAPTQKRTYVTESATSRKDITTKKRTHGAAFAQDAAETIEYRRRQNTVAARRSRKRKLEYQQALEAEAEELRRECGMWKRRAQHFEQLCGDAGIAYQPFEANGKK